VVQGKGRRFMSKKIHKRLEMSRKIYKKLELGGTSTLPDEDWNVLARADPQAFARRVMDAVLDSRVAIANHIRSQYQRLTRLESVRDQLEVNFREPVFLARLREDPERSLDIWQSLGTETSRISLNLMNINKVMVGVQKMAEVSEDYRRRVERTALPTSISGAAIVAEVVDDAEDKKALKDMAIQQLRELLNGE